jgi:hypothetical protein
MSLLECVSRTGLVKIPKTHLEFHAVRRGYNSALLISTQKSLLVSQSCLLGCLGHRDLWATKKRLKNLIKWSERVVILIKTLSMAIKKSIKADVTDNPPLCGV